MKRFTLTKWILAAIILGVACGFLFGKIQPIVDVAIFVSDVFLRLLKMIIIPLIITSIISGVVGMGKAGNIGKLGAKTLTYYITTSLLAILTGLIIVNIIDPGTGADLGLKQDVKNIDVASGSLVDIFKRMIPVNLVDVMAKGKILPIIFFCIIFGFFITKLEGDQRRSLTVFFQAGFEVMMKMTHFVMWFAPIGIWGLLTKIVATTGFDAFKSLGLYAICVLLGLGVHAFITLPLICKTVGRFKPTKLFQAQSPALLTAFSTASSSATLPITIQCIEKRGGVSNKTSSFVLPLGATINMDGTALYECVAAMFIAQAYGIDLSAGQQFVVVLTALLASIGAAGIPMAGLVMITIILTAVGLPLEGVGLILAVDRILDMCRTTVNVWSDSCGTATLASLDSEKHNLH